MADDRHDDAERDAGADRDDASPSIRERPPVATATLVRMGGAGRRTTVLAASAVSPQNAQCENCRTPAHNSPAKL